LTAADLLARPDFAAEMVGVPEMPVSRGVRTEQPVACPNHAGRAARSDDSPDAILADLKRLLD